MKFYLETNAIRKLASQLNSIAFTDSFTSILTLSELLSGIISDKEYGLRKAILTKIYNSKIYIDFDLPFKKFLNAYGQKIPMDFESDYIQLIETLINSSSLSRFTAEANSRHKEIWEFIKKLDSEMTSSFSKAFEGVYEDYKLTSDLSTSREFSEDRWSNFKISDIEQHISRPMIIHAETIAKDPTLNPMGRTADMLIRDYDNSLNTALVMEFLYADRKILWGSAIGKNDMADLTHLYYLDDLTSIIVTDDKLLQKMFDKLMPNRILSAQEYLKIYLH